MFHAFVGDAREVDGIAKYRQYFLKRLSKLPKPVREYLWSHIARIIGIFEGRKDKDIKVDFPMIYEDALRRYYPDLDSME
jgi:hypothetical protein